MVIVLGIYVDTRCKHRGVLVATNSARQDFVTSCIKIKAPTGRIVYKRNRQHPVGGTHHQMCPDSSSRGRRIVYDLMALCPCAKKFIDIIWIESFCRYDRPRLFTEYDPKRSQIVACQCVNECI
ncbi:hypothetical protein VL15_37515 [Burkholderia cepacia]|uniref:Uncharacterized protein n=1 Tax=Burkholderia cepacia TaxID=292 RepID=A0A0J5W5W8_BURCE|nr:hypothetical protein VL15_37515 [Burkholderia cepacia]